MCAWKSAKKHDESWCRLRRLCQKGGLFQPEDFSQPRTPPLRPRKFYFLCPATLCFPPPFVEFDARSQKQQTLKCRFFFVAKIHFCCIHHCFFLIIFERFIFSRPADLLFLSGRPSLRGVFSADEGPGRPCKKGKRSVSP